jgi:hypothetical protein
MAKCCVLFEVRDEFLNIIKTSVGFSRLIPPIVLVDMFILLYIIMHTSRDMINFPSAMFIRGK